MLLTTSPSLKAAALDVVLTALIVLHLSVKNAMSGPDSRAWGTETSSTAYGLVVGEPVHHGDLELVGALPLWIIIHRLVRKAEQAANHIYQ